MRNLSLTVICIMAIGLWSSAARAQGAADNLSKARSEFAADHIYAADALLQKVIDDEAANQLQVEEALFLQSIIYYGDVLGAMAVIEPLAAASAEGSGYKGEVSRQLLLARRAFYASASRFVTATVLGSKLEKVQITLPSFTDADLAVINSTLSDKAALDAILTGYESDSAVGKGLLAKASRLGLYTGFGRMLPPGSSRKFAAIRSSFSQGSVFTPIMYMDFIAEISVEMAYLVNEPNGPDLVGLAKRADERIMELTGGNPENLYVKNATRRMAGYKKLGKE
ncbi:hypothetical protein KDL29_07405 [bacterium]|nr:hypothetical protein [bacterium]